MERLCQVDLDDRDSSAIVDVLDRHPDLLLKVKTAFELQIVGDDQRSPLVQSLWMFFADLLAAFIPFFPLGTARIVSICITALLLLLLGVARGIVARSSILCSALETLGIATAAAITGYFIGKLVTL